MSIFDRDGNEVVAAIVLDREAVRAAFIAALLSDKVVTINEHGRLFKDGAELKTDQMVHVFADRLIASLSGGLSS